MLHVCISINCENSKRSFTFFFFFILGLAKFFLVIQPLYDFLIFCLSDRVNQNILSTLELYSWYPNVIFTSIDFGKGAEIFS